MSRKRYRSEEIIGKLREADVLLSQGKKVVDVDQQMTMHYVLLGRATVQRSSIRRMQDENDLSSFL